MNSIDELRQRLSHHVGNIRGINVTWNVCDGGPRMNVCLLDYCGRQLDYWEDWMILGSAEYPGTKIIRLIVKQMLGAHSIRQCVVGRFSLALWVA